MKNLLSILSVYFSFFGVLAHADPGLTLILVRHGQSEHNIKRIFNSNPDHPNYQESHLTEAGREKVAQTAQKLLFHGFSVDQIYASPLPRTMETAHLLCAGGIASRESIISDARLKEIQAGDLEGQPLLSEWRPEYAAKYHFETEEEITERVVHFLEEIKAEHPSGTVIVISHGPIVKKLLTLTSTSSRKLLPGEAGVVCLVPEEPPQPWLSLDEESI